MEYRYNPLGRRTYKILWRYGEKDPETIRFDWQGVQLAGEQSDREPDHYVQYVYTEGSYEPLARVDSVFDDCEIYWYHTELNGLPERVTDADGQTVWRGQFSTWGKTERELSVPQWQVPQNLRFQGQYLDRESGLHYNLFRYYDPVAGRYTQMDPIGLAGGINTYSYVGDPLVWMDPLGLICETTSKKWIQAFEREHGDAGIYGLRRHGAGTTLEQQKYRATTGYTPDAVPGRPVDATRFLTYQDHQQAIERALKEYDPKIHTNGKVDFDMPQTVAEGYKMGGEEYFSTRRVRANFNTKTGKVYSIFGIAE